MTVEESRFISEMLRAIREELGDVRKEQINQGLRQTAVEQQLLGINTYLAALQHGLETVKHDMRRVKQRLELVEE